MEGNHPPSSSRIKCQPSFVCNKKFDGEGMKAVAEPGRMRGKYPSLPKRWLKLQLKNVIKMSGSKNLGLLAPQYFLPGFATG